MKSSSKIYFYSIFYNLSLYTNLCGIYWKGRSDEQYWVMTTGR